VVVAAPVSAAVPRVSVRSAQVIETDSGAKAVRAPLVLSRRAPAGASVRVRTRPGSASSNDFQPLAKRVRIRRGKRRAAVVLRVSGDLRAEPDERFSIRLSAPRELRLGRRRARVTILDDDTPVAATLALPRAGSAAG
jgi:hypothetical protein